MYDDTIQLPPIPRNYDSKTVALIWEYTKLSRSGKEMLIQLLESAIDADKSEIVKAELREFFNGNTALFDAVDPELSSFLINFQNSLTRLMRESCEMSCMIYLEHFIEGKSAPEIAMKFDLEEGFVDMYVQYYNHIIKNPYPKM